MIRRVENKFARAAVCAVLAVWVSLHMQSGNVLASTKASETAGAPTLGLFGTDWIYDPSWLHKLIPEKTQKPEQSAPIVTEHSDPDPVYDEQFDQTDKEGQVEVLQASVPSEPVVQILKYEVSAGDTMYKIARAFGLSLADLLAANPMNDPNRLSVGQTLYIPEADSVFDGGGERPVVKKVLNSTLTAYTAGAESTGKTPSHPAYGITKSGSKATEGRTIAVDPSLIPLGSTVLIEGIGIRKAEDVGSAIKGARIDVFMNDLQEALQFGVKRNVKVYVLEDRSV